jgi:mono/diheme cytochrome c family protein
MRLSNFVTLCAIIFFCSLHFTVASFTGAEETGKAGIMVRSDDESIATGKKLFESKCAFCHKTNSSETIVGPGLKGIMKGDRLPVSKKQATPENIAEQMKNPYEEMPSVFEYVLCSTCCIA